MRRLCVVGLWCVCVSLQPGGSASAQTQSRVESHPAASRALTQFAVDQWDDRDGLPQITVRAVAQAKDGYIWLGTQEGLVRFDGVRFTVYDAKTVAELTKPYISALAPDRDGSLWIGTQDLGVIHKRGDTYTTYRTALGSNQSIVQALFQDRAGTIWVGMNDGLARIEGGRVVVYDSAKSPRIRRVNDIREDNSGGVWIISETAVHRVIGNRIVPVVGADGVPLGGGRSLAPAASGGMWLGLIEEIALYENGVLHRLAPDQMKAHSPFYALWEDPAGDVWFGGGGGLGRVSKGRISMMPVGQGPATTVFKLVVDREKSLWLGTYGDGLMRVRATPLIPVGYPEGVAGPVATAMLQDRTGAMWLGSTRGGVNVLRGDSVTHLTVETGHLPHNFVRAITEVRDGSMWLGTVSGVSHITKGRAELHGQAQGFNDYVRSIVEDRERRLWFATATGLLRFRPGPPRRYTTADGLADNVVYRIMESSTGDLWVGTHEGLSRLAGDRFVTLRPSDGLPDGRIIALFEGNGALWIGTGGAGMARYRNGRFSLYTAADGLCDDNINSITEDLNGRVWLSSNKGIFSLSYDELNGFADGRIKRLPCTRYGRNEGMRSGETVGTVSPSVWRARDGRLWYPTASGAVIVDPEHLDKSNAAPPVVIEEVHTDDELQRGSTLRVKAGTNYMNIRYTGLTFIDPASVQFRYKLAGFDHEWVEAGARRTAYYNSLPPKRYTFLVQAANTKGEWTGETASMSIDVLPFFYQTGWFQSSALLLFGVVITALAEWWTRRMRRNARELRERVQLHSEAERRYRDAFEKTTDVMMLVDLNGQVTALNPTAERMTGYTSAEIMGTAVKQLLRGDGTGLGEIDVEFGSAVKPFQIVAKDGSTIPVEVSTYIIDFGAGPVGVQLIARDMRERFELEKQLRQAQKMEAIGHLAGGVAHDFNNLLTVIQGNGSLLLEEAGDNPVNEEVTQMIEAAERAARLTQQLLVFSRKEVVQTRTLDVNEVIRGIEPLLRRAISEDIAFSTMLCEEEALIDMDRGHIEQVLMNLALNARDAMPRGGMLAIETFVTDRRAENDGLSSTTRDVVLTVTDTGHGMSEHVQAHIFEPFYTTKERGKGTGLGLSTVYGIVTARGGDVRCTSAIDAGTTFRIRLPHSSGLRESIGGGGPAVVAPPYNQPRGTILLAEDEAGVRNLVSRVLRRRGFTVLEARHGRDALDMAAAHHGPIELLITDMIMPELDGRTLFNSLAAARPGIPVLFMSGYTDDEMLKRGLLEHGEAFIAKPFAPNALVTTVESILTANLRNVPSVA